MGSRYRSQSAPTVGLTSTLVMLRIWVAMLGLLSFSPPAGAVSKDSPEVQSLIKSALAELAKPLDEQRDLYGARLGGKCLVGLAFIKSGQPEHARVDDAIQAVRSSMTNEKTIDVYSNGIAIVFLCELAPQKYRREIEWYLNLLHNRQKGHGGWGYDGNSVEGASMETGDTSQTQYASLGYWTAYRHGFPIQPESLERLTQWLLKTQDPDGCWGYQGIVAEGSQRVHQEQTGCSMLAAGMGSTLICADLLDAAPTGLGKKSEWEADDLLLADLPAALRETRAAADENRPPPVKIRTGRVNFYDLIETIDLGKKWMGQHYAVDIGKYNNYYLYATERYQSFYELMQGDAEDEPKWYSDGFEFLRQTQRDGSWDTGCGRRVDTAFAVLFLLRSTQKSIQATLGEGTLVGGRGIPANVASAKLRGNHVVVEQVQTKLEDMLTMIDDEDQSRLDELARDPTSLVVANVDAASARRLQQLVRGGEPAVRLLAVRALGRTGNLDYVPTLIYALTDPDHDVVLEARNSLEFVSRSFKGYGPPDDFTDKQQFDAVEAWKNWYRSLRPGAPDK